ncbi:MAG TPA: sialidase family protein [Thermomicrobiales bacterium]|nr:sialidase family protein [Thermomicrobiales bacterium]
MRRVHATLRFWIVLLALVALATAVPAAAAGGDVLVTNGSPPSPFPQNKQNEPGVAIDASHPMVLAAGSNDELDLAPCDGSSCPFTTGVGVSGIYFSFDGGKTWTQPTYQGWSARTGTPMVGPIGTLPGYFEAGLASDGDPALAFGPRPGPDGTFSWANGSRLYYANLAANFGATRSEEAFKGFEAIAVSRTDDVQAAASGDKSAWMAPVIVSRQNAALFSDKDAIWADNAASSPFFGNVYICNVAFRSATRSTKAAPEPVMFTRSTDGGATWSNQRQLSQAANNITGNGRQGCTIRTDSRGTVYVFWEGTISGQSVQFLARSFDGGATFERPRVVATVVDVGQFDPASGDFTFDGVGGARTDSFPSVDIANGAPSGAGAPNTIVMTWADARNGLNHEQALVTASTDRGQTWSTPMNAAESGDRPDFPAVAISPDGSDVYLVYDGFLTPWQTTTSSPRTFQGVVRHASGALAGWTTLHRGATGDARGSSANGLTSEFLGDYNWAAATDAYGMAVWNDARNAADCPAVDAYRQSLTSASPLPKPAPLTDCPATFGNSDIYGGQFVAP